MYWAYFQTHLTFGREFTEAVEMKQVAQQEAERARYIVERVSVMYMSNWLVRAPHGSPKNGQGKVLFIL